MRVFFDTSVFVPLFLGDHEHHVASQEAFLGLGRDHGFCSAHSLAELYSSVTRLPPRERVPADRALQFVEEIAKRLELVTLDAGEHVQALKFFAETGIIGGATYDGLHVCCARKAKADIIYTWNIRHFQLFGPEIEKRLRLPGE
jgi:predicted nucleic acid-binding protein